MALAVEMNDHVAKPIDVAELFAVLDRWIEVAEESTDGAAAVTMTAESVPEAVEVLSRIPELDAEAGLAHVGGNVAVYRKVLIRFRTSRMDALHRIHAALGWGAAAVLRPSVGPIPSRGWPAISAQSRYRRRPEMSRRLLMKGNASDQSLKALERALGELAESLAGLAAPAEHKGDADASKLIPLLDCLHTLLDDSVAAATAVLDEIEAQAGSGANGERFREIGERVGDFDFDRALGVLKEQQGDLVEPENSIAKQ